MGLHRRIWFQPIQTSHDQIVTLMQKGNKNTASCGCIDVLSLILQKLTPANMTPKSKITIQTANTISRIIQFNNNIKVHEMDNILCIHSSYSSFVINQGQNSVIIIKIQMLQFPFRKCFLLSHPPLKPDSQPLQQLLPPESSQTNLLKSYSFSQLKLNESKEKLNKQFNKASQGQIQKYKSKSDSLQKQNLNLKNENQKLKQANKQYLIQIQERGMKYAQLLRMYDQTISQRNNNSQQQNLILRAQVRLLKLQIQKKQDQIISFQLRNQQSKKLLQKLNENITKKQDKLLRQKNELARQSQLKDKQITQLNQKIQQQYNLIQQIKTQRDERISNMSRQISQKNGFTVKINQLVNKIDKKNAQLAELKAKYQKLELNYNKLSEQNQLKMHQTFETLSKEITNKNQLEIKIFRLEEQKQALQNNILELNLAIYELKKIQQNQTNNQTINRQSIKSLEQKIQKLQAQTKQGCLQFQTANLQIQKLNQVIEELRQDKKILSKEKNQVKSEITERNNKIQKLQTELASIRENERVLKSLCQNLEFQKQKFFQNQAKQIQQISYLQRQLKQKDQNQKRLQHQIFSKQKQIQEMSSQIEKLKIKYSKLDKIFSMYKAQMGKKSKNNQKNWRQLKQIYQQQVTQLQEKLRSLQSKKGLHPAQIITQRISVRRYQSTEKQSKQSPFQVKIKFQPNYQGFQKQNVWRGLNNDSLQIQQ